MLATFMTVILLTCSCGQIKLEGGSKDVLSNEAIGPQRLFVAGIDRSKSYTIMDYVKELFAKLIQDAEPGTEFHFRWISHNSYSVEEFISQFALPSTPEIEASAFDVRANRNKRLAEAKFNADMGAIKEKEIAMIRGLSPVGSKYTDIYGFIAYAAELFENVPSRTEKRLYVASDLYDNVKHKIQPDLSGVHVICFAIEHNRSPEETRPIKDHWRGFFEAAGAASVQFQAAQIRR